MNPVYTRNMIDTIKAELEAINMDLNLHTSKIEETQSTVANMFQRVKSIERSIEELNSIKEKVVDLQENINDLAQAFNDFTNTMAAGLLR